jgi:hypothetical protein
MEILLTADQIPEEKIAITYAPFGVMLVVIGAHAILLVLRGIFTFWTALTR